MADRRRPAPPIAVYLEVGAKRLFACAVGWPGWSRSGKDEELALEALVASAHRYAPIAAAAGHVLPDPLPPFEVVERLAGSATTDFGAPGAIAAYDLAAVDAIEAAVLAAVLEASWQALDAVAVSAPAALRKGPRGGGRDRDAVVAHVIAAEASYARKLGVRHPAPAPGDRAAVAALRNDLLAAVRAGSDGGPAGERRWPLRYGVRRTAWHVLDHVWEIEDRSAGDLG